MCHIAKGEFSLLFLHHQTCGVLKILNCAFVGTGIINPPNKMCTVTYNKMGSAQNIHRAENNHAPQHFYSVCCYFFKIIVCDHHLTVHQEILMKGKLTDFETHPHNMFLI